jgi:hypothetical protein
LEGLSSIGILQWRLSEGYPVWPFEQKPNGREEDFRGSVISAWMNFATEFAGRLIFCVLHP